MLTAFDFVDLMGTFAFALSGATAGVKEDFDFFGVFALTTVTAVGGGVIRDICISDLPPAGLTSIPCLLAIVAALVCVSFFSGLSSLLRKPRCFLTRWDWVFCRVRRQ